MYYVTRELTLIQSINTHTQYLWHTSIFHKFIFNVECSCRVNTNERSHFFAWVCEFNGQHARQMPSLINPTVTTAAIFNQRIWHFQTRCFVHTAVLLVRHPNFRLLTKHSNYVFTFHTCTHRFQWIFECNDRNRASETCLHYARRIELLTADEWILVELIRPKLYESCVSLGLYQSTDYNLILAWAHIVEARLRRWVRFRLPSGFRR